VVGSGYAGSREVSWKPNYLCDHLGWFEPDLTNGGDDALVVGHVSFRAGVRNLRIADESSGTMVSLPTRAFARSR
jgi:hypothetical protein